MWYFLGLLWVWRISVSRETHTFFLKTVLEANRLQLFVEAKPWISPNYGIHYARQDYIRLLTHVPFNNFKVVLIVLIIIGYMIL